MHTFKQNKNNKERKTSGNKNFKTAAFRWSITNSRHAVLRSDDVSQNEIKKTTKTKRKEPCQTLLHMQAFVALCVGGWQAGTYRKTGTGAKYIKIDYNVNLRHHMAESDVHT